MTKITVFSKVLIYV